MQRIKRVGRAIAAGVVIAGCGSAASKAPPQPPQSGGPAEDKPVAQAQPAPAGDPAAPELRLPQLARPLHHDVELTIDPAQVDFTGTIVTQLQILQPTKVLWLNAEEIAVDSATFEAGGAKLAARAVAKNKDYLALIVDQPLEPGKATLTIKYRGKANRDDGDGIYTFKEGDRWYAFTQFESTDARQAFPCFDEPSYKVPWRLTLHTRQELSALGNTPIEAETPEANGMKAVRFAATPPLPSYLIAFAIGTFDFVDAGKTRAGGPIRIVTPRGRGGEVAIPAKATKPILDLLEDYFGSPYPYAKLDVIAVPVFNAGAMENPGLITYREAILLTKPGEETRARHQVYASIGAHELAHQWFGNYVTLAWWDDTWLNEAFASWMASKIVDKWKPEWDELVSRTASKSRVMVADSLDTARAVRQPIATANDITNAFDGITYAKGEAVLGMIESWIGPAKFQEGVRAYMKAHAWGNATYSDFAAAMVGVAGPQVRAVLDAFVLQSGVPVVSTEVACTAGAAPKLVLAQERYKPTGSKIDPKRTWQIPMCVRWGAGAATGHDCTVLAAERAELPLSAKTCPDWVMPNEAGVGYYRSKPPAKQLDALLARAPKTLAPAERVQVLSDVNALVASGDVPIGTALALVDALAKDKSRHIVDLSVEVVARLDEMVPPDLRPNYERLIRSLFRPRAIELGWQSKRGEGDETKQLRPTLLLLVAGVGRDAELIQQATALAYKWLDNHKAVEPEVVTAVLSVAARHGDQKLFDRLIADAKREQDRIERTRLLNAVGSFTEPKLTAQALAIALGDQFDMRESLGLLQGAFRNPATREQSYRFVVDNFDTLLGKLPEPYRPYMSFIFVVLCDDRRKAEVEAFFRPRMEKLDGGPRVMAQALEQLSLCSAAKAAQTPGVIAYLKKH